MEERVHKVAARNLVPHHPDIQCSPSYTTVRWKGHVFYFSPTQAKAVELLLGCRGMPIHQDRLLEHAGSVGTRLRDLFRSGGAMHPAWRVLILTPEQHRGPRGSYMIERP